MNKLDIEMRSFDSNKMTLTELGIRTDQSLSGQEKLEAINAHKRALKDFSFELLQDAKRVAQEDSLDFLTNTDSVYRYVVEALSKHIVLDNDRDPLVCMKTNL